MKARVKVLASIAVVSAAALGGMLITHPQSVKSDFDINGLNQQVQNHEARISNNEADISELQKNTNTAPAQNKQTVPVVTAQPVASPQPTPTTEPQPVVASVYEVSTKHKCVDGHEIITRYYSDGSSRDDAPIGSCTTVNK